MLKPHRFFSLPLIGAGRPGLLMGADSGHETWRPPKGEGEGLWHPYGLGHVQIL